MVETYGTSDARLWRTRVVKEKVPLLIAPSRKQLLNSPLKEWLVIKINTKMTLPKRAKIAVYLSKQGRNFPY